MRDGLCAWAKFGLESSLLGLLAGLGVPVGGLIRKLCPVGSSISLYP
jgi:hypothetical protein